MYQTKYRFNIHNRLTWDCLTNPDMLHKAVQRLFDSNRVDNNVLYFKQDNRDDCIIYVRSDVKPTEESDVLCLVDPPVKLREDFDDGDMVNFYLRCNPTKQTNGKRYFIMDKNGRCDWLARQGEKCGFVIERCSEVTSYKKLAVKKASHKFSVYYVDFMGRLRITDKELFKKGLTKGFGAEKSYGMGLLMYYN